MIDRRRPLAVAAAAVVAVALAVSGAVLLFGGSGDEVADADAPDRTGTLGPLWPLVASAPSSAPADGPAGGAADGPARDDHPKPQHPHPAHARGADRPVVDAAAAYLCWNDSPAARRGDCSAPTGRAGMNWVFPASRSGACSSDPTTDALVAVVCRVRAPSGRTVRVTYAGWPDRRTGAHDLARHGRGGGTAFRGLTRWDGHHRTALMYRRAPWSVTVAARKGGDRDDVLAGLRWRPPVHLLGRSLRSID